ncbi:MAG: heavy-metal-associated domain-containing protein [Proteobacteria bacterium]|nr:heavy-metal-associated domain-containing protein [Pseudomonadota bacterium]
MSETFAVKDIHCTGCAKKITQAITAAEPGARVEVNIEQGIVTVDPIKDRRSIVAAIEGAGYALADNRPSAAG